MSEEKVGKTTKSYDFSSDFKGLIDLITPKESFKLRLLKTIQRNILSKKNAKTTATAVNNLYDALKRVHVYSPDFFILPDTNLLFHPNLLSYLYTNIFTYCESIGITAYEAMFLLNKDVFDNNATPVTEMSRVFSEIVCNNKHFDRRCKEKIFEVFDMLSDTAINVYHMYIEDAKINQDSPCASSFIRTGHMAILNMAVWMTYVDPDRLYMVLDNLWAQHIIDYIDSIRRNESYSDYNLKTMDHAYESCQKVLSETDPFVKLDINLLDSKTYRPSSTITFYGFGIQEDGTIPYKNYHYVKESIKSGENIYPKFDKGVK